MGRYREFRIAICTGNNVFDHFEPVQGMRVNVAGFEDVELFTHRDEWGEYRLSEVSTGMALVRGHRTVKDCKFDAEVILRKKGIEAIRTRIEDVKTEQGGKP